jgi:hypothetical protein
MEAMTCTRCGTVSHPEAWDDFVTCYHCNARLVRRTAIGRGWEELTAVELERLRILDLEWYVERDQYRAWDNWGGHIPSVLGSSCGLIAGVALGLWLLIEGRQQPPGVASDKLGGLGVAALILIGLSLNGLIKALGYRSAYPAYYRRRLEAVLHPAQEQVTTAPPP